MKTFFQYFGFNQIEQRGFIIFTALILLILFVPYALKLTQKVDLPTYGLVSLEDANPMNEERSIAGSKESNFDNKAVKKANAIAYFYFDPNNLPESSWLQLGFSDKQIKVIKNYEAKGGRFYKKEDLAKIYVISEFDYNRVSPYIKIAVSKDKYPKSFPKREYPVYSSTKNNKSISINAADTLAWKSLPGIGSVLAKRIVKYRESLGGFYKVDQIREIYGLSIETFEAIEENLILESELSIRKIPINTCTMVELQRHPYINRKQAETIVNYRLQHGNFENLESLSQIKSLDNVFLRKIELYLEY